MLAFYMTLIEDADNQKKFEQLYLSSRKTVLYIANSILHDTYEAEDAVHEAFIGIARNIHKVGDVNSKRTSAYLACAVRNACYSILEKNHSNTEIPDDEIESFEDDSFEDLIENMENAEIIKNALGRLKYIYSDALIMHYGYGMTVQEIAEAFGNTEDAIRQRISRGKKALSEEIKKEQNNNL